jgi:hypothetical protein
MNIQEPNFKRGSVGYPKIEVNQVEATLKNEGGKLPPRILKKIDTNELSSSEEDLPYPYNTLPSQRFKEITSQLKVVNSIIKKPE